LSVGPEPYDACVVSPKRLSALPSARIRVIAFAAVMIAGVAGGLIGWSFVDIQCTGKCTTASGVGAVVGGGMAAIGVAVVAVLAMRAMGEWRRIQLEDQPGAASESSRNPSA
jgi:hypothetical protein